MTMSLSNIQDVVGGEITGDAQVRISGVSALETAAPGTISFAEKTALHDQVRQSAAAAVIVGEDFPDTPEVNLLRVVQPRRAFVEVMSMFAPARPGPSGIHPSAVVAEAASLADGVAIGECAVIRPGARVGQGTVIDSGAHVGDGVDIGADCYIGPNVSLMHGVSLGDRVVIHAGTVIGGDGFGYLQIDGRHVKVPQIGIVRIDDDVEIGCNVCIDRATLGVTRIGRGTKIDNQVHIAHNVNVGEDVIITGQVGLSGSVTVRDRAMFAGQSGVADHLTVGEAATIGGATAVIRDVADGEFVWGYPARPIGQAKREMVAVAQLPDLIKRLRALEKRVAGLKEP